MKKSSVEQIKPYSPAKVLALVDLPDPGKPLIRIKVLLGLSAYIILLQDQSNQSRYTRINQVNHILMLTISNEKCCLLLFKLFYNSELMNSFAQQESNDFSGTIPPKKAVTGYGNLKVFCTRPFHLSLGPEYPYTYTAVFFLSVVSCALYLFSSIISFQTFGRVVNIIIVSTPVISFVVTALKNPGFYNSNKNKEDKTKYCEDCKVFKPKNVYHCVNCNVCIEGFDHHCQWLAKCVGRGNIVSFYVFMVSTQIEFFYFWYLIYRAVVDAPSS